MGAVVGLVLGAGIFCLWWACWPSTPRQPRGHRLTQRVREELIHAGMDRVHPAAVLAASGILFLGCGLFMLALSRTVTIATCFATIGAALPWVLVRHRAQAHRRATRGVWPEAVDGLVSGVRAGMSLPAALIQLADRGPVELREDFAAFALDYRTTGRFEHSLDRLKDRLADPVADRIVEALRITRQVGGSDLGGLLRTLAEFLREEAMVRDELEARQSWTVNGARLAVAAPWLVLALLSTRPEAVAAYDRPQGAMILLVGGLLSAAAYVTMIRMGRLPGEPRVLR